MRRAVLGNVSSGKREFPRFRISLRCAMLVILVCGLFLGWRVNMAREQRAAIRAVRKSHGSVHYKHDDGKNAAQESWARLLARKLLGEESFGEVVEVGFYHELRITTWAMKPKSAFPEVGPIVEVLEKLTGLPDLTSIRFDGGPGPSDTEIAYLSRLKSLREVNVGCSRATDEGLRSLAKLPKLESLSIEGVRFSDKGLACFQSAVKLKLLKLRADHSDISDEGVAFLKGLKDLEDLELAGSKLTDQGLMGLRTLKKLVRLNVYSTRVTGKGVNRFQAAMPKSLWIQVNSDQTFAF